MPPDEDLIRRIREHLADDFMLVSEKRMFGGLCFLFNGHMVCAASGRGGLMTRVPAAETEALTARPHVSEGGPGRGWVRVEPAGVEDDEALGEWIERALAIVTELPPKT